MHCNFANTQFRGDLDVKMGDQIITQVMKVKYMESIILFDRMVKLMMMSNIKSKLGGVSG